MSRFLSERLMNVTPYTPGEQPQDQKSVSYTHLTLPTN